MANTAGLLEFDGKILRYIPSDGGEAREWRANSGGIAHNIGDIKKTENLANYELHCAEPERMRRALPLPAGYYTVVLIEDKDNTPVYHHPKSTRAGKAQAETGQQYTPVTTSRSDTPNDLGRGYMRDKAWGPNFEEPGKGKKSMFFFPLYADNNLNHLYGSPLITRGSEGAGRLGIHPDGGAPGTSGCIGIIHEAESFCTFMVELSKTIQFLTLRVTMGEKQNPYAFDCCTGLEANRKFFSTVDPLIPPAGHGELQRE